MTDQLLWIKGILAWNNEVNEDRTWYRYLTVHNWIADVADGGNPETFWDEGDEDSDYIWVKEWVDKHKNDNNDSE